MTTKINSILKLRYFILVLSISLLSCEADVREVYLYTPGKLEATSTNTAIKAGETVTYTSTSTKVRAIKWTFQGGSPGSSADPNVTVKYAKGGSFTTTLEITYVDNLTEKKTFAVEVEAPVIPPVVVPVDGLKIYSNSPDFTKTAQTLNWVSSNQFVISETAEGVGMKKLLEPLRFRLLHRQLRLNGRWQFCNLQQLRIFHLIPILIWQ